MDLTVPPEWDLGLPGKSSFLPQGSIHSCMRVRKPQRPLLTCRESQEQGPIAPHSFQGPAQRKTAN